MIDDERINLEDLIKQAEREAKAAVERTVEHEVPLLDVIAAFGVSTEAYIRSIHHTYGIFPGESEKLAVTSMMTGVLAVLKAHEQFGGDKTALWELSEKFYDQALLNAMGKAGDDNG